jgi:hypothetical protein
MKFLFGLIFSFLKKMTMNFYSNQLQVQARCIIQFKILYLNVNAGELKMVRENRGYADAFLMGTNLYTTAQEMDDFKI